MANAAVNGLGRIGRATLKILLDTPGLEVKALNDLMPIDDLVYLLRYDTVYGRYSRQVGHDGSDLVIDGKKYTVFSEKDPSRLPWKNLVNSRLRHDPGRGRRPGKDNVVVRQRMGIQFSDGESVAVLTSGGDAPGMNAAIRANAKRGNGKSDPKDHPHEGRRGETFGICSSNL